MKKQLPILLCEDGSVCVEDVEALGFAVITYRQGTPPPQILGYPEFGTVNAMGFSVDEQEED